MLKQIKAQRQAQTFDLIHCPMAFSNLISLLGPVCTPDSSWQWSIPFNYVRPTVAEEVGFSEHSVIFCSKHFHDSMQATTAAAAEAVVVLCSYLRRPPQLHKRRGCFRR